MMDITPLIPADRQVIDAYGPGRFRISKTVYEGAVIVFPDAVVDWGVDWQAQGFAAVGADSFQAVLDAPLMPEILLVGTGPTMQFFPPRLRQALKAKGVGAVIDVMDTGAACRTYNVLLAEGRLVAAALLPL